MTETAATGQKTKDITISPKVKGNGASKSLDQGDPVVFFGDSGKVTPLYHNDHNQMDGFTEPRQKLEGFEPQYRDFVDYILRITHKIWEEKGIGVIYETYHNDCVMHVGTQHLAGLNTVISGTMQQLHAFPDRRLIAENVIWSEDPDATYFSSHRIHSTATNLGDSSFGPATGKPISFRTVADCKVYKNKIVEEWLVRDNLHIVRQLGMDPNIVARKMAKSTPALGSYGLSENRNGQFIPEIKISGSSVFAIGEFMQEMMSKVWGARYFNCLTDYYSENAVLHTVCNQDLTGSHAIKGWLVSFFASFPNARVQVERVTCNKVSGDKDWDVAVRWRVLGLHEGIGFFGSPSHGQAEILGVSQYKVRNGNILEEWLTFDGLDVLRQIEGHRLSMEQVD